MANIYLSGISNPKIKLPTVCEGATHIWHLFVFETEERDGFQKYLVDHGIGTVIHYPIPSHLSKAYACLSKKNGDFPIAEKMAYEVLSLPMWVGLQKEEFEIICKVVRNFKNKIEYIIC